MFIKPEIVAEIPAAMTGKASQKVTKEMASDFYRTLVIADGQWVKFFTCKVENAKHADRQRAVSRHFIHSPAMRPYFDQMEYVTRTSGGVLNAYAKLK